MADKTKLGDRMKCYENVSRTKLMRRNPVIIRLDGKAFHTFTRGMKRPFDDIMVRTMQDTMQYLCENIQGCVFGYTQSDEITLILIDYKKITSCAWFDNNIQKIVSVSASMATMAFNKYFSENVVKYAVPKNQDEVKYFEVMTKKMYTAMFDSRVFSIPKEEVTNCLIWRQQDATRNSIQSVGQANFSHKELYRKGTSDIQDMLMLQKGINWNDIPTHLKRGSCCIKGRIVRGGHGNPILGVIDERSWFIDTEIPIFTKDRNYIDRLVFIGE